MVSSLLSPFSPPFPFPFCFPFPFPSLPSFISESYVVWKPTNFWPLIAVLKQQRTTCRRIWSENQHFILTNHYVF